MKTIKLFMSLLLVLAAILNASAQSDVENKDGLEKQKLIDQLMKISNQQAKVASTLSSKTLRIGDKVPDILIDKMFNYPGDKAKLSDFKGKHILLDFWSRSCSSCIGAFPKMEKLQQQFADHIQILAVCTFNTYEALSIREPGFPHKSTSVGIRNTKLPLVFNSLDMVDLFPHTSEPYLVWIDKDRILRAMIDSWNVNEEMITTLLRGKYDAYPLATSFKRVLESEKYDPYNPKFSILEEGKGRNVNKVVYLKKSEKRSSDYVILAKLGATGGSREIINDIISNTQIGDRRTCLDIPSLFRVAYPGDDQLVVIESSHLEKYYVPETGTDRWMENNVYSYEVFGATAEARQAMLKEALREYFKSIQPSIELRKITCLELRRTSDKDKLKTAHPNTPYHMDKSGSLLSFRNISFAYFVSKFKAFNQSVNKDLALPILDETGFDGSAYIDIELKNLKDTGGLNEQLKKYDLTLKEVIREEEVLVIKETDRSK